MRTDLSVASAKAPRRRERSSRSRRPGRGASAARCVGRSLGVHETYPALRSQEFHPSWFVCNPCRDRRNSPIQASIRRAPKLAWRQRQVAFLRCWPSAAFEWRRRLEDWYLRRIRTLRSAEPWIVASSPPKNKRTPQLFTAISYGTHSTTPTLPLRPRGCPTRSKIRAPTSTP